MRLCNKVTRDNAGYKSVNVFCVRARQLSSTAIIRMINRLDTNLFDLANGENNECNVKEFNCKVM